MKNNYYGTSFVHVIYFKVSNTLKNKRRQNILSKLGILTVSIAKDIILMAERALYIFLPDTPNCIVQQIDSWLYSPFVLSAPVALTTLKHR